MNNLNGNPTPHPLRKNRKQCRQHRPARPSKNIYASRRHDGTGQEALTRLRCAVSGQPVLHPSASILSFTLSCAYRDSLRSPFSHPLPEIFAFPVAPCFLRDATRRNASATRVNTFGDDPSVIIFRACKNNNYLPSLHLLKSLPIDGSLPPLPLARTFAAGNYASLMALTTVPQRATALNAPDTRANSTSGNDRS